VPTKCIGTSTSPQEQAGKHLKCHSGRWPDSYTDKERPCGWDWTDGM